MPLANYITEFLELNPYYQASAVLEGKYNRDQLESLKKHCTDDRVLEKIEIMLNHGELELVPKSAPGTLLDPVAVQINEEYLRFEGIEKDATMSMLKIGLLMEHAKKTLPHGQFKTWAESNLTIKYRHALRFRQLAHVFISAQQVGEDEMFELVDPANSQAALGDKLRNMAFEFIGDKTQGELFEEYGIRCREKAAAKQLPRPKPKQLAEGETQAHRDATELVYPLMTQLQEYIIGDRRIVQHFALAELKTLQGDLIDAKHIVDDLIKAG